MFIELPSFEEITQDYYKSYGKNNVYFWKMIRLHPVVITAANLIYENPQDIFIIYSAVMKLQVTWSRLIPGKTQIPWHIVMEKYEQMKGNKDYSK